MTRPTNVYRVVITKWPTHDGKPWPRFLTPSQDGGWERGAYPGDPHAQPADWMPFGSEAAWPAELEHLIRENEIGGVYGVIDTELAGMVLPSHKQRTYLSRPAAERWVRDARLLGAECRIEIGRINWEADQ